MFKKFAKKLISKYLVGKLDNPMYRATIVRAINDKIDIPSMSERQEQELFESILKATINFIKGV